MIPAEFFDRVPSEVREIWLEPIAELIGWPIFLNTDTGFATRFESASMGCSQYEST